MDAGSDWRAQLAAPPPGVVRVPDPSAYTRSEFCPSGIYPSDRDWSLPENANACRARAVLARAERQATVE
jgi:hypothetical protein